MEDRNNVKGFFILKDSEGNILVSKHNMIVKSGRMQIMNHGFPTDALKIFLSKNKDLVRPDEVYDGTNNAELDLVDSDIKKEEGTHKHIIKTFDTGAGVIHGTYNSAGLIFGNGKTLFSRLTFPEVTIAENKSYTIEYYIYF